MWGWPGGFRAFCSLSPSCSCFAIACSAVDSSGSKCGCRCTCRKGEQRVGYWVRGGCARGCGPDAPQQNRPRVRSGAPAALLGACGACRSRAATRSRPRVQTSEESHKKGCISAVPHRTRHHDRAILDALGRPRQLRTARRGSMRWCDRPGAGSAPLRPAPSDRGAAPRAACRAASSCERGG